MNCYDFNLIEILDELYDLLAITDRSGNIILSNKNFETIFKSDNQLENIFDLIDPTFTNNLHHALETAFNQGRAKLRINWTNKISDIRNQTTIIKITIEEEAKFLFVLKEKLREDVELSLLNRIIGQEIERERISKELHDGLGQELNVINMYTHSLKKLNPHSQDFQSALDGLLELASSSVNTLESIIIDEFPNRLKKSGLFKELQQLMLRYQKLFNLKIDFKIHCHSIIFDSIDDFLQINIYRIVQEFFTNSLKYANATELSLNIFSEDKRLDFNISDNGLGFDQRAIKNGNGLVNIQDRLTLLSADYNFDSSNKGTQLQFSIYVK